jgi:hypothetical protein
MLVNVSIVVDNEILPQDQMLTMMRDAGYPFILIFIQCIFQGCIPRGKTSYS